MYTPPKEILEKYAHVLINFALRDGQGIKPGDVVLIRVPECAKPLYVPLRNTVLRAGGMTIMQFIPDDVESKSVFDLSSDEQLSFFPTPYFRGLLDSVDHAVSIIAEYNKFELKGVDPQKIMLRGKAGQPYMKWREEKEAAGKFTWTLGLYGTPAMAAEVKMTEEAYWDQIIKACFLDEADPVTKWREVQAEIERVRGALNKLAIKTLRVLGDDIDLTVGIGPKRQWLGGSGRNIPSFEIFISPDWRQTEGKVHFNQPLYHYGNRMTGITLRFKRGVVVEALAEENQDLLREMIATENADKIGEFSLTDGRLSRITKVMAETLFDENIGGKFGNTHLAIGNAYKDSYPGDASKVTSDEWKKLGYNESVVHTDIVSTTDRVVTAQLEDGGEKIIYEHGQFTV